MKSRARSAMATWRHELLRSINIIRNIHKALGLVTFIASIACIMFVISFIGYEHEPQRIRIIAGWLRAIQLTFIVNVLFNIVFNFKKTISETRVIKWIVDILILISALALLYPHPHNPWIPWLSDLLYSRKFIFSVVAAYAIVDFCYGAIYILSKRTNPSLILSISFLFFILIGSFLLMMPKCTYHGINFVDSLFVSTSAVCITGLTTLDIPSTFTPLGQIVLALLIQIGGLGVMTFTSFFALFFSGSTSVYSQLMVKDMIYTKSINALLPTLLYILGFTIIIEAIGALGIWFSVRDVLVDMSASDQIGFAAFHSLSAFCNAGFSNLPGGMANPLLMNSNQSIYWVVSIIVFAGSIGFPVLVNLRDVFYEYLRRLWGKIRKRERRGRPIHIYNLNTKISLYTTLIIFAVTIVVFLFLEYNNSLAGFSLYDKISQAVFNATTPRSSGFISVNPAGFLNVTIVFILFLMWIGGASQSTAGGIKVNTFAAILINLKAIILGRDKVTVMNRTIAVASIRRANAVVTLSIISYLLFAMTLLYLEPTLPTKSLLFEACSALFTIGSSLGVTEMLSPASKLLLIVAMFIGRVGILSLLIGITGNREGKPVGYPTDNLIIN